MNNVIILYCFHGFFMKAFSFMHLAFLPFLFYFTCKVVLICGKALQFYAGLIKVILLAAGGRLD